MSILFHLLVNSEVARVKEELVNTLGDRELEENGDLRCIF